MEEDQFPKHENPNDKLSTFLKFISFGIPLIGLIIYVLNRKNMPKKARSASYCAFWGFVFTIFLNIILILIGN